MFLGDNINVALPHGPHIDINNGQFWSLHTIRDMDQARLMMDNVDGYANMALTFDEVHMLAAYHSAVWDLFMLFWEEENPPNPEGVARMPGVRIWVHQGQLLVNPDAIIPDNDAVER